MRNTRNTLDQQFLKYEVQNPGNQLGKELPKYLFWKQASCTHPHSRLHPLASLVGPPPFLTEGFRAELCATAGIVFPTRVSLSWLAGKWSQYSMPSKLRGLFLILYFNLPCLWKSFLEEVIFESHGIFGLGQMKQ